MKNIRHKRTWISRLCLLLLTVWTVLGLSGPVMAADKYIEGESADFQITLDENGGAWITETWDLYFGGDTITRYRRYFLVPDACYASVEEVKLDGEPLQILDARDESRPEGCAAVWQDMDELSVEIYLQALEEKHTISISYYMADAVILHDDVAEFRHNLTTTHEAFSVETVTSHITIPYGTQEYGLYFWAHGPEDNASFTPVVEDGMVHEFDLYLENVTPESPAHVRFAMPLELFPEGSRFESGEALDTIIEEESGRKDTGSGDDDDDDPYEEEYTYSAWDNFIWKMDNIWWSIKHVLGVMAIVLCVIPFPCAILFAGIFEKIGKVSFLKKRLAEERLTPEEAPEYYRSLPDNTTKPAMVYKLGAAYKNADTESMDVAKNGNAFSATIMDFVETGLIRMIRESEDRITYQVTEQADTAELTDYEATLLEIYRGAGADKTPMTTKEITEYMHLNYEWCKDQYRTFDQEVEQAFNGMELKVSHEQPHLPKSVSVVVFAVTAILIFIGGKFLMGLLPGIILSLVFGFLDTEAVDFIYKDLHPDFDTLTQEGENQYAKWMGYVRFLKNFTLFEEREMPDILVWRRYLVYATALGCSKNILAELKIRFPEVYEELITDSYIAYYDDLYTSADEIDQEGAYTIRSSSSDSDSGSSDSGWGDVSDSGGGGDYDSGGGGSDFD